ncbi:hypothetical protein FEE96_01090 [Parasedimentitalea maritima]|uniref:Uncharacterized protein n=1 Tax=Parasedimentitalea maritima TaxID=2578117 RepID=A0ABY2UZM6_9RHOB|nr:hypothetical protein [Zongyanglinia marina]TLP68913.1 hypothetical protein FEE96_01090 [Zongyanglinia marina]
MSVDFYEGMYIAIAVVMIIVAMLAVRVIVRSTAALLSKLSPVHRSGAFLLEGLLTIVALYIFYSFLVVFLLIFTGAAAPTAPDIPEAFGIASMLWLPVTVIAFVWEVYSQRKRLVK